MNKSWVNVKIDKKLFLDMLEERLQYYWGLSKEERNLYLSMYEEHLVNGNYSETEFDFYDIVKNDINNNCSLYKKDEIVENEWERLVSLYKEGIRDITSYMRKSFGFRTYIEALDIDNEMVLIRYS